MGLSNTLLAGFRRVLPSPFVIALLLTGLTMALAWGFGEYPDRAGAWKQVLRAWEGGVWNPGLLVFAYQMMLILVLGHVVVLSRPMERVIGRITALARDGASAALLVASSTVLVAFFNWGLALIFGAILARKVGEHAQQRGIAIHYPLVGACGYLGLMTYNGGISCSAAIKASEPGHITTLLQGVVAPEALAAYPASIPTSLTVFHPSNLWTFAALLIGLSTLAWWLGKRSPGQAPSLAETTLGPVEEVPLKGAEQLDRNAWVSRVFAGVIFTAFFLQYWPRLTRFDLTPDMLNFFMLGLGVLLHGSIGNFRRAVGAAIGGTAGILIQFPLYFGIMGIMANSGLIQMVSDFFVAIGTETTFPIYTFISAGIVNLFIPSGGGQWAVQGPVILQAAIDLGVSPSKTLMALAYGDQLTNMMQPFWALPLLGITGLKAREILPYTLIFMLFGVVAFLVGLLFW
ncbi:TIGR00366 family protein [Robiginitalea sp. M366]|uniref:short-chain fatty acid transporter n=1 Tax=Robiginitalea aestuariiviva TaxID=3036903 RepID=UPI00240E41CF|nr:TIGR00366 family protein [Robiginitalea aestuariiviva]MDG1571739.1 TIGR00366 family protein [Robiginitalea aestuariiviva]